MNSNRPAFLQMIGISELGKELISLSDRGFNVIVGSTPEKLHLFNMMPNGEPDYSDHPRQEVWFQNLGVYSSAAGLYQINEKNYDFYKKELGLRNFAPDAQTRIASRLITECQAWDAIDQGSLPEAIMLCSSRWASLPGNTYGQHENAYAALQDAFIQAGGKVSV
ncbi:MAG: glycoside hydrolase family 104 protein [Patescibacteria group bacterium]|nr:glycoside hydrolase family 104 protein [Patescibacteria group bacterium]